MPNHIWTSEGAVHMCWRTDEDVTLKSYQRVGEYQRDRERGGFRADRYRYPAVFPERANFEEEDVAKQWILEVL